MRRHKGSEKLKELENPNGTKTSKKQKKYMIKQSTANFGKYIGFGFRMGQS